MNYGNKISSQIAIHVSFYKNKLYKNIDPEKHIHIIIFSKNNHVPLKRYYIYSNNFYYYTLLRKVLL